MEHSKSRWDSPLLTEEEKAREKVRCKERIKGFIRPEKVDLEKHLSKIFNLAKQIDPALSKEEFFTPLEI